MYHDESSDNGGNGTWIRKPQPQQHEEKPKLKVQIENGAAGQSPSSAEKSDPSTGSTATLLAPLSNLRANSSGTTSTANGTTGSVTKVGGLTEMMMHEKEREREMENEREKEQAGEREKQQRQLEKQMEKAWEREGEQNRERGTDTLNGDKDGWAMRPPPEAVYERLEHYFRNHDLDKPVIEATSGGTSPTSTDPPAPPQATATVTPTNYDKEREKSKIRAKKSIRYVAEDAKRRIDRTSKADSTYSDVYLRKRNTKFWGGKLEEVTTHQARSSSVSSVSSGSPDGFSSGTMSKCLVL
jgi:mitogen-activated protein kinase kinase kinase